MVPSKRTPETAAGCSVLQPPQPSKLRTSKHGAGWCSGKTLYPNWFRVADVHHVAADWTTRSRSGRRQQSTHDCVSNTVGVLSFQADRRASQSRYLEEPILNLCEFHGCRTFRVVVSHRIDPRAHRVAPHRPRIVGLQ